MARPGHLGLKGHLRITCSSDEQGKSYLSEKSFAVPIHISKPYWDGHALLVNLVSPTAGLLEGDKVECDVGIESGASLVLTAPAATRVHTMQGSDSARLVQKFTIQGGGFLEYNPEPLILQRDSAFSQHTRIDLEDGAELLFLENLLPGRITHGEAFEFATFRNRLEIFRDGRPLIIENYHLSDDVTLRDWKAAFPEAGYASFYSFSPTWKENKPPIQEIEALQTEDALIGMTQVDAEGWAVRILTATPIHLRQSIQTVRKLLLEASGRSVTDLRRL